MVPGPLFAVVASESPRVGARAGPIAASGHAALEALMTGALALGLSALLASELVKRLVGAIGGLTMLFLAVAMIKGAAKGEFTASSQPQSNGKRGSYGPLLGGILATALNPYWYLWWATVAASYIMTCSLPLGLLGVLAFYLGHIAADLTWYSAVSATMAHGGKVLGERLRWLIAGCGLLLTAFGIYFLKLAFLGS